MTRERRDSNVGSVIVDRDRQSKIKELCESLSKLSTTVPKNKAEVLDWYETARKLEEEIIKPGGLAPEIPEVLWHYLADADIRLKSQEYADVQNRQIEKLLGYLNEGEIPEGKSLTVDD